MRVSANIFPLVILNLLLCLACFLFKETVLFGHGIPCDYCSFCQAFFIFPVMYTDVTCIIFSSHCSVDHYRLLLSYNEIQVCREHTTNIGLNNAWIICIHTLPPFYPCSQVGCLSVLQKVHTKQYCHGLL